MVARALRKSALREIGGSLGRYLAILLIVMLGVGFFAGLRSTQPAMIATGAQYLAEQRLHDFRLLSTLGFTDADVAAFDALPDVTAAGAYQVDLLVDQRVLRAHSLTDGVDLPVLSAGRMPETAAECLADDRWFSAEDLGRELRLDDAGNDDAREALAADCFTVVGVIHAPRYLNYERGTSSVGSGTVSAFLYLPADAFTGEAYHELLLSAALPGGLYSEEYDAARDALAQTVEALLNRRAALRYETLRADGEAELQDARQALDDGWRDYADAEAEAGRKLADAARELDDAEAALADGREEVRRGRQELQRGETRLQQAEAALADGEAELAGREQELRQGQAALAQAEQTLAEQAAAVRDARQQLTEEMAAVLDPLTAQEAALTAARQQLADAIAAGGSTPALAEQLAQVDAGLAQVRDGIAQAQAYFAPAEAELTRNEKAVAAGQAELAAQRETLRQAEAALTAGQAELAARTRQLDESRRTLNASRARLADAARELDDAEAALADGRADYETAQADADRELADARQALADGAAELADGEQALRELTPADTYLLDRDDNIGYACFKNDTAIVEAISVVFPLFFFLVAAFVCVTTMTRMVEERRTQTGVLKALGYSAGQIMGGYLFYAGSAAALGWLLGYAVGVLTIPRVIWSVYGIMYGFAPLRDVFSPALLAGCFAAAELCSCGTVLLVCRGELRQTAASLIRPKSAKAGRLILLERIRPLWRRLRFLQKVSLRNIFRYKSRLVMMLIGIGGCTALLLAGFGIRDSIQDIAGLQFGTVQHYDLAVTFTRTPDADTLRQALETPGVAEGLPVHQAALEALGPDGMKTVQLLVSSTGSLDGMMTLARGGQPADGQALASTALAEALGVAPGEALTLRRSDSRDSPVTLADTFDNYLYYYVVLTPALYEQTFGHAPDYETLLLTVAPGQDHHRIAARLAGLPDAGSVTVNQDFAQRMRDMLGSLNYIVVMVVICAAALALIVLYHLTNININERAREIATLKVLGFYPGETASYIFREILTLSAMGAVAGLPLGVLLHRFVMSQIKVDLVSFPVWISPVSAVTALGLTLLFALGLSLLMRPKLRAIDMVESLKSVE